MSIPPGISVGVFKLRSTNIVRKAEGLASWTLVVKDEEGRRVLRRLEFPVRWKGKERGLERRAMYILFPPSPILVPLKAGSPVAYSGKFVPHILTSDQYCTSHSTDGTRDEGDSGIETHSRCSARSFYLLDTIVIIYLFLFLRYLLRYCIDLVYGVT